MSEANENCWREEMTNAEALNRELERLHKLAANSIDADFRYMMGEIRRLTNILIELAKRETGSQPAEKK